MPSGRSEQIIRAGSATARVKRAGMLQLLTFRIKKVGIGKDYFIELHTIKTIDMSELQRLANEFEMPVEAENGRAFPAGRGAKDFLNL